MIKQKKQLLLFIHGLRGDHHGLRFIEQELSKDYDTINIDLPGYGDTPELKDLSLDGYSDWLYDLVKKLPQKPVIIGHSMGSIVASHFVAKYPETVSDKLVLLSPIFRKKTKSILDKTTYMALKTALTPFTEKNKHKILASPKVSWTISHFLTSDKTKQHMIDQEHLTYSGNFSSAKSLLSDIKISSTKTTLLPKNKHILIIIGKNDQLTSPKLASEYADKNQSIFLEIDRAGHLINYETPIIIAEKTKSFLES